jgi:hypothetical protein
VLLGWYDRSLFRQLELPQGMELPGPVVIVLINSTGSIARQRPWLFDEALDVLVKLAEQAGVGVHTTRQNAHKSHTNHTPALVEFLHPLPRLVPSEI